jgi:hypothetical protein
MDKFYKPLSFVAIHKLINNVEVLSDNAFPLGKKAQKAHK